MSSAPEAPHGFERVPLLGPFWRIVKRTVSICMKYRVTGLAAEAGYFALLCLPPLAFGLLGLVGYVSDFIGRDAVQQVTANIDSFAGHYLTEQIRTELVRPMLQDAVHKGRPDVISAGFLLSLWSGSRALNVLIDTGSIMYGQGGDRGIIRTRMMSLSLYFVALVFSATILPLIVIGPQLLSSWLPPALQILMNFYWPLVGGLTIFGLATFFYLATPARNPWVRDLPGAALTLAIWVISSMVLRIVLTRSTGGTSIYGPLAATIMMLIWLYFLGISVLIGAALNAAIAQLWPVPQLPSARQRVARKAQAWIDQGRERRRGDDEEAEDSDEDRQSPDDAADPAHDETVVGGSVDDETVVEELGGESDRRRGRAMRTGASRLDSPEQIG